MRSDRIRFLTDKITELFDKHVNNPIKEEYKQWTLPKKSDINEENYDSVGCLLAAQEKTEGGDFHYDTVPQMYQTTVVNKTYDSGFSATLEEVDDDPMKVVNKLSMSGIMKSLAVRRELNAAAILDGVFTTTGADGVAYAANNHPLDTNKTALVNNNLMAPSIISPSNVIAGCNMFNSIRDYAGNIVPDTEATAIIAHKNKQADVNAVLMSNLRAGELSNTKNTVPMLKAIFGRFINLHYWHLLDENYNPFIFQRRTGVRQLSERDRIKNGNYYWNAHERYRTAQINPGYGHVSNAYTGS